MKRRLKSYKTLMFEEEFIHLRYACHILNLIVRDVLKKLEDGIAAIWNCAKYVKSSSSRLDKFREFAVLEQCRANAKVPLDVITRWNNTYLMLEAALKYEAVFGRMAEEDSNFKAYFDETDRNGKSRVRPLSSEDWRNAEAFCLFLKKFYEATVKLSAWKKITANILFCEMVTLQTEIDKAVIAEDPVLNRVATSMKIKFNKYWGSFKAVNKIIMIANVLDPRYKLQWAKVAMEKVNASYETIHSIQGDLKKILLKMYYEYKGNEGSNQSELCVEEDLGLEGDDLENLDEVNKQITRERMAEQSQCIRNELDQYLSDMYVSLLAKNFEIHKWWKANA
ncbi:zinc finger BED domain-containing protein RICESLEEPER 1-like [Rosa rugosa]|uniref:zinc finger BED domain-containing protein RICESLEEPER 1-like n=1 Tax=Rosa rugosa TaxID=74645 RepID=UPI002B409BC8|nr:zinc finger BED domain-containing protein RICESLEEPER 1-like [Rosa rugosa]XP_062017265.1 zinc finger BED domain-containing protein RICESLEEPER 1-like [Rosa rugosa]XP_062017266.1 zinc finger BED domain-containing protein RICESLEEPER 1-like [Rosa rugosa]XP_062017267.1 zinc finger BED domain-containing protein RICESLEEPER 1-like [Rosa rugosa]XP_062017268.1 zinc finger BED domain-containing protein RICESLEEPER 1-like [Rosa rugosa]XP_062017269.1 zinc finger BED domain-containing protein RICESLEE